MHIAVFVKKFKPKQELQAVLKEGKVYHGFLEDGTITINNIKLNEGITDNGNFLSEVIVIDETNINGIKISKKDKEIINKVHSSLNEMLNTRDKVLKSISAKLKKLDALDSSIVDAIDGAISHVAGTYDDKYEVGAVNLQGLMRESPHGKGFNAGNAAKYVARYLTDGYDKSNNIKDLHKAIHYLCIEIARHDKK